MHHQPHYRPSPVVVPAPRAASIALEAPSGSLNPVHMGILLTLAVFAFIVMQGSPGSLNVQTPARLPAPAIAPVGQQTLPMRRETSGMPSAAAAASVAVERGGTAPAELTANVHMKGIPSPAAAATMAPATLPMRANDGMTLPRTNDERDGHATEAHYGQNGGAETLAMRPVRRPAVTPMEAAAQAEAEAAARTAGVDGGYYNPQPTVPNTPM